MNSKFKKVLVFVLGTLMCGVGIALLNSTPWGNDSVVAFVSGISTTFGIDFGIMNGVVLLVMVFVAIALDKKQVSIMTFANPFLLIPSIQFVDSLIPYFNLSIMSFVLNVLSMFIIALGGAFMVLADYGKSPYDALIFASAGKMKLRYYQARWIVDGICLLGGFILGGKIGIGTVIAFVIIGNVMEIYMKYLKKTVDGFIK